MTETKKLDTSDAEFVSWLEACQAMVDSQLRAAYPTLYQGMTHTKILSAERGSKFIRIVEDNGTQRSVWCFVAREDGSTKALGTVRKGDILKAATWAAPAKTARGNIYNGGTGGLNSWTGPNYLR